jgi:hypothetical protein
MAIPVGRLNSLQQLVDRVGVSEDVVGGLPIGVLVGAAKARQPERRRIGEGAAKFGRSGARADRCPERIHDRHRVVAEERLSERHVI